MLADNLALVSRSKLRRLIRQSAFPEDEGNDLEIEFLFQEIYRRRTTIGTLYPFSLTDGGISLNGDKNLAPYAFLLCICTSAGLRSGTRLRQVDLLFDSLVEDALRQYLGRGARSLRFGWPPSTDRPTRFPAAIQWLCANLGLPVGKGRARPKSNDGGLDIIVWRPFTDQRGGYVSILAQCTMGDDWFPKARDIVDTVWSGWVDFGKLPITCLAIPFVIPPTFDKYDELRRTVTLILDRTRLCDLLDGAPLSHYDAVRTWTERELAEMSGSLR